MGIVLVGCLMKIIFYLEIIKFIQEHLIGFSRQCLDEFLDGELFAGRENFQDMGVVRKKNPEDEEWLPIKYVVYDLPEDSGKFEDRVVKLKKIVEKATKVWNKKKKDYPEPFCDISCPLVFTDQIKITSLEHLDKIYKDVLSKGGEGVMIKDPVSLYEDKRSDYMLKYKPCFDAEAVIVDYKDGNGKYSNMLGAFICKPLINYGNYSVIDENEDHEFCVSGMDDEVRGNYLETHSEGTVITYEYSGMTDTGKPRFARYLRVRDDIEIRDAVNFTRKERKNY